MFRPLSTIASKYFSCCRFMAAPLVLPTLSRPAFARFVATGGAVSAERFRIFGYDASRQVAP
jgi:hypothetical protein